MRAWRALTGRARQSIDPDRDAPERLVIHRKALLFAHLGKHPCDMESGPFQVLGHPRSAFSRSYVRRKSLIGGTADLFSACRTAIDRPPAPGMDRSLIAHPVEVDWPPEVEADWALG